MCRVELSDFFRSIGDVFGVFPGVAFQAISFPFDQVLESASEHPTVDDLFHNVFHFAIYKLRRRWLRPESARDWVHWGRR